MRNQQPKSDNKTRAQKEGTPWWKIVGYVIGGFILLVVISIVLFIFLLDSLASDVQRPKNQQNAQLSAENELTATPGVLDARQQTNIQKLKTALGFYHDDNSKYPQSLSELKNTDAMRQSSYPDSINAYRYETTDNGNSYCLGTCFDDFDDAQSSQQCIDQLSLSCDGTPYTVSPR